MTAADDVIDVSAFINESQIGGFQYAVVALCGLTVFLDGFDVQAIAFVAPSIIGEWHVSRDALGPIFVASLVGLLIGALIFGPIADKVGRRKVLLACTFMFGALTLATGFANSVTELLVLRFLTGLGLGGAMPNAIALTAEYCPQRRRATLVMIMFTGFSLGAAVGGLLASVIIPTFGWRGVFYCGGVLPVLLFVLQLLVLPESIRFLVISNAPAERLATLVRRIDTRIVLSAATRFDSGELRAQGVPVVHLFRDGRALGTILLWIMFFVNLLALYFMQNWLPVLLHDDGLAVEKAVFIASLFQFGGTGAALIVGFIIDRFTGYAVLPVLYVLGCVFVIAVGQAGDSVPALTVLVSLAGFCVVGGQNSTNAHAAMFYPTLVRATGVGWCLGIGRLGAILGPLIAGLLIAFHWPNSSLFIVAAIPLMIAFVAVIIMGLAYGKSYNIARADPGRGAAE
jgi:AAHS family 4-hydroxybenzoate transporter-like MFS transporter